MDENFLIFCGAAFIVIFFVNMYHKKKGSILFIIVGICALLVGLCEFYYGIYLRMGGGPHYGKEYMQIGDITVLTGLTITFLGQLCIACANSLSKRIKSIVCILLGSCTMISGMLLLLIGIMLAGFDSPEDGIAIQLLSIIPIILGIFWIVIGKMIQKKKSSLE